MPRRGQPRSLGLGLLRQLHHLAPLLIKLQLRLAVAAGHRALLAGACRRAEWFRREGAGRVVGPMQALAPAAAAGIRMQTRPAAAAGICMGNPSLPCPIGQLASSAPLWAPALLTCHGQDVPKVCGVLRAAVGAGRLQAGGGAGRGRIGRDSDVRRPGPHSCAVGVGTPGIRAVLPRRRGTGGAVSRAAPP